MTALWLQERLAAQREEVRGRAAEIEEALGELDERRREAEHREALLAAEDERLADMLTQVHVIAAASGGGDQVLPAWCMVARIESDAYTLAAETTTWSERVIDKLFVCCFPSGQAANGRCLLWRAVRCRSNQLPQPAPPRLCFEHA